MKVYIFSHCTFAFETILRDKAKNIPKGMVVIRRDYLRKLKHRSSKYQTAEQQRLADLFSTGNEVIYVPVKQGEGLTESVLSLWRNFLTLKLK